MSNPVERLKGEIERRLRGPGFSNVIRRLGIDPKRYWLLMDLFHTLSTREEMQGQLGRQPYALRLSAYVSMVVSGLMALGVLFAGGTAQTLATLSVAFMVFTLIAVLLSEAANSLVNPEEALALAHQPIDGATYTAAKLSHLLNVVVHYVLGWTLLPALVTPLLKNGRWLYPMLHLLAAFAIAVLLALLCCSIFGLLMRVVPPRRMKSAAQFVQAIPAVIIAFLQFSPRGTVARAYGLITQTAVLEKVPGWFLAVTGAAIALVIMAVGIRSLSADYLIHASAMVHGKANAATRDRRSLLGEVVRRVFGGQVSRAGFDYTKRMMLRDWQFRRQLLGFMPMLFFMSLGIFGAGLASPFSSGFSSAHFIPHMLGFILYVVCLMLPYGTDYKGVWLFHLTSNRALGQFVAGVHAFLWLVFVVLPFAALLPLLAWRWSVADAAIFILYGATVSSIYLAVGLRAIDGVPFGKQIGPKQLQGSQGGMRILIFSIAALIAVGIQYLLYRSAEAVWVATAVTTGAAYLLTRKSLHIFHAGVIYHLGISSQTSTMVYKEVGQEDV